MNKFIGTIKMWQTWNYQWENGASSASIGRHIMQNGINLMRSNFKRVCLRCCNYGAFTLRARSRVLAKALKSFGKSETFPNTPSESVHLARAKWECTRTLDCVSGLLKLANLFQTSILTVALRWTVRLHNNSIIVNYHHVPSSPYTYILIFVSQFAVICLRREKKY